MAADDLLAANTAVGEKIIEKKVNVTMEKIRSAGKCLEMRTRLEEALGDAKSSFEDTRSKVETLLASKNVESMQEELTNAKTQLGEKHDEARKYLEGLEQAVRGLEQECKGPEPDIQDIRARLLETGRAMTKGAMQEFSRHTLQVTRVVLGVERDLKMAKDRGDSAGAEEKSRHPLHQILHQLVEGVEQPMGSVFEAKGGLRAALVAPLKDKDPARDIANKTYVKKGMKEMEAHMKATGATWCVWKLKEGPKKKQIIKDLEKGLDAQLRTKLLLPKCEWADAVFDPHFGAVQ